MYFGGPNSLMKMEHTKAKEEEKMSNERHQTETVDISIHELKLHVRLFVFLSWSYTHSLLATCSKTKSRHKFYSLIVCSI